VSEAVLEGLLFDGRTAAATPVRVTVCGARLRVSTADGEPLHEVELDRLVVTEPFSTAPRTISLPTGAVVEIPDGAALTAALDAAGRRPGLVDRLERRWPATLASLVACVALLAAGYRWGLPAAARWIAASLPASAEQRLGNGVLELLDGWFLRASALPDEEQREVERRIAEAAHRAAPGVPYRILFRSVEQRPGVNAFALPGGTIVFLDELVRRTGGDDRLRLVAVFGHELGHQTRRHSTQAFLKAAGVGAVASLLWGDFSGQAAGIPAALAMLDYSRDAEREADEDAVGFLRAAGRSATPMLEALCLLEEVEREMGTGGLPRLLSSHPNLRDRIAHVREVGRITDRDDACRAVGATCGPDGPR
jgi:Zn-dependent protease with chaperone function